MLVANICGIHGVHPTLKHMVTGDLNSERQPWSLWKLGGCDIRVCNSIILECDYRLASVYALTIPTYGIGISIF